MNTRFFFLNTLFWKHIYMYLTLLCISEKFVNVILVGYDLKS